MNLKKTYTAWLSVALLLILTLVVFAGCNKTPAGATEIFIQPSQSPRLTYVQGQELDLSRGVLTVAEGGEQHPIPLTNEEITVTGYDKDTLGKQTVTVTYKGLTTTFDVTVIPRALAENFETDYFIGDTFDASKGRLRIARDDGSTFNVNMNSETVTLTSFNSDKDGQATVTVTYSDGGITCDCTFTVTVHKPDEVSLTPPKQTTYASHETELNLSGGYLTVRAAAPSTFSKFVNLTQNMVSGYDPSKVTPENLYEPVTQVVTITYAGKTFDFTVEITYSSVFLVQEAAKELADLDWTEGIPDHSIEQGVMAADALIAYLNLSPADRALITHDELMAVARPGTVYLNTFYGDIAKSFSDAFTVSPEGYVNIVGNSYDAIAEAVVHLNNPDHDFNVVADLLNEIREVFPEEILYGTLPFTSAISSHTEDSIKQITEIFQLMLTFYDELKDIPDDWTVETLPQYATEIETAVSKILLSNYVGISYNFFYDIISTWRTNDDYFDIIYSYYYYVKDNGQNEIKTNLWGRLPAPGSMNDWYVAYAHALTEANNMNGDASQVFLYDASGLMYYYAEAIQQAALVKTSGNQLYLDLFELLDADNALDIYVRRAAHGFIFQMGEALGLKSVESVWGVYIDLLDVYLNQPADTYVSEHGAAFEEMYAALEDLTPAELYSFLSTVNCLYDTGRGNTLVLDSSVRPYNALAMLLTTYYREVLPSDALDGMFTDLLVAMENAALFNVKPTAVEDLGATLTKLDTAYGKLSAEDQAIFNSRFGDCYNKYKALYAVMTAQTVTVPNGWADKFTELNSLLDTFDAIYAFITSPDKSDIERSRVTPVLFAVYERAYRVYGEIAYCGDDAVVNALTVKTYTSGDVSYTLAHRFFGARSMFVTLMVSSGLDDGNGHSQMTWDVYTQASISEFLGDIAYLLISEFEGKTYTGSDLAEIMEGFRTLGAANKVSFYRMSVNLTYYGAIERAYVATLGEDAREAIKALLDAEIAYSMYAYEESADALAEFNAKMATLTEKYAALDNAAAFDKALGDVYSYYLALYQA